MERMQRLDRLWGWLPAFRAVAETEHLPTAAQWLCVTPPALSRSVKLLEAEIGTPLFDRVGRRLVLNNNGRHLLSTLRRFMRSIDDVVSELQSNELRGPLRVAAPVPIHARLILPAMDRLLESHPDLEPELLPVLGLDVLRELQTGALDIAITKFIEPQEDLLIERLVTLETSIYCGKGHPLFGMESPSQSLICDHAFVVPREDQRCWPTDVQRKIGARVGQVDWETSLCISGRFLAQLPVVMAAPLVQTGELWELPMDNLGAHDLFSARRLPLRELTPEAALLQEMARGVEASMGGD